jgi:hypothetical protein
METVKQYFENYPQSKVCYSTSDGFIFPEKNHASAHGNTLKKKEVKEHIRVEFFDESEIAAQNEDEAELNEAVKDAEPAEAVAGEKGGKKNPAKK